MLSAATKRLLLAGRFTGTPLARLFLAGQAEWVTRYIAIAKLTDPRHYFSIYPELCKGADLVQHYLDHGARNDVVPNGIFDKIYYRERYLGRQSENGNLFLDFALRGSAEGYSPSPFFDVEWYIRRHGLNRLERSCPLGHYLQEVRSRPVATSPLLDHAWYLERDPDARHYGHDVLSAYLKSGVAKNLAPNPLFDGPWYCAHNGLNGDTAAALAHYFKECNDRQFDPHPLFDTRWYLACNPDVARGTQNPLAHYLEKGAARGLSPHPLFDPAFYLTQVDSPASSGNPLVDYLGDERNWSKKTHPLFDGGFYQSMYPDVEAHHINPLRHYVQSGGAEGRRPCPLFWGEWYAASYPEVVRTGGNPLIDYVTAGARQGRNPNPIFDGAWYLARNGDVASSGLNPLSHYVQSGASEGRDPGPLFDASWYQARYPETNKRGVNPLDHYLGGGMAAGYQMRPVDRLTHDCDALDIPFEILRAPATLTGREVCLFVTYAADGRVEDHVSLALRSYKASGLAVVLVVVTEGLNVAPNIPGDVADGVIARINHGWDFAAWATALAVFPDLWSARLLILANDSVYGPTSQAALSNFLDRVRCSDKELIALTDSYQVQWHMMSYFTAITTVGLGSAAIRTFWNGIRSNRDKATVIREYELRSIERCLRDGVTFEVLYPARSGEARPGNPTLDGWQDLLGRGFPFVKVQLLRDFMSEHAAKDWVAAFAGNPGLAAQIELHLTSAVSQRTVGARPIPGPKQRFVQPESLTTYYGATPACRPMRDVDLALEVPFRGQTVGLALPERIAVVAHVFYPDFCPTMLEALKAMPVRADVFVSTDTEHKSREIAAALSGYENGSLEIRICPNVGRDIAPLLVAFDDVFARYDVFLHLHSKRSPHQADLADWRDFLLANLVGTRETIRSILGLFAARDVGIVFSQHYPAVRELINFGYNFETMRELLSRCGVELTKDLVLEFPSSSFFWGRSAAMRPLLDLGLAWSDFPEESGQVDGTLAHAIERSLCYVAEAAGFSWAKVASPDRVEADVLVPVHGACDMATALARVHRPLLRNRLTPNKEACFLPEVNRLLTRRDGEDRPRLNLIVPTLQPAKVFGGLTTAIKLFKEVAAALGEDVDLRIISLSERVDMVSMLQLPDFRLVSVCAASDAFPKVVLDASERQRGYLGVRRSDVFIATAWWTATAAFALRDNQAEYFGVDHPIVYLIQDHEPHFYHWSSHYQEARQTYARPSNTIAVVNSEELATYLTKHYSLEEAYVMRFELNATIGRALKAVPRERIVLVYGRPSVARNCFDALCLAIGQWQCAHPVEAAGWRIVSVGESYDPVAISQIRNLEVLGKVSLQQYGELLSRAAVGISLMASPHPSYPPLEMAYAGMLTITNAFEDKDLSRRSRNILTVPDLGAGLIAAALARTVNAAAPMIGTVVPPAPLADIACSLAPYDPTTLASRLRSIWSRSALDRCPHAIAAQ